MPHFLELPCIFRLTTEHWKKSFYLIKEKLNTEQINNFHNENSNYDGKKKYLDAIFLFFLEVLL